MTPRRGWRWSHLLWAVFTVTVVVCGVTLLRACSFWDVGWGWNFCPAMPSSLSAEVERGAALRKTTADLELQLAQKQLACASLAPPRSPPLDLPTHVGQPQPQQTAQLKPPPLPADRWNKKDLGVLQGCWTLGQDAHTTLVSGQKKSDCLVKAERLCFDDKGMGKAEQSVVCPQDSFRCNAPLKAQFKGDGTLVAVKPQGLCGGTSQANWLAETYTCRRVNDAIAVCNSFEFRRESP